MNRDEGYGFHYVKMVPKTHGSAFPFTIISRDTNPLPGGHKHQDFLGEREVGAR